VTFEELRGYWPQQTDDTTGITEYLDNVAKYVVSSTLREPEWDHTTVVGTRIVPEVQALKSRSGGDIVTTGSMTPVSDLIAAGLVEEYRLFVSGRARRGRRLFADATGLPKLLLEESRQFRSGIVLLRYRTA
jgi:dihydrofolate reductase